MTAGAVAYEHMFAYAFAMQLRLDAADRLVELVEERRGPVYAEEAARRLFAARSMRWRQGPAISHSRSASRN